MVSGSVERTVVAVACESEVGEALEVDSGCAGGEPDAVALGAAVGASSAVVHEPGDAARGHGPVPPVGVLEFGCGCLEACDVQQVVVGVQFDGAPGFGGGASEPIGGSVGCAYRNGRRRWG